MIILGDDSEMEIRHLHYFIEVAKQKNFTKAAEKLYVSQPTISKMVKSLEEELGTILLERRNREVILTDAGKAIFLQAQSIVTSFKNLHQNLEDVVGLNTGQITIGLPPMVGGRFFAPVIGEFARQYPNITLQLVETGARSVESGIEEGELDVGVVVLPFKRDIFQYFSFVRDPLRLIVPPDHPLALKKVATYAELKDESFVFFAEDFTLHERILERCHQSGFKPKVMCKSSQWDFIAEVVAAKLGIAFMPQRLCLKLESNKIYTVALEDPPIEWHLAVIWNENRYLSYATRKWLEFTRHYFETNGSGEVSKWSESK